MEDDKELETIKFFKNIKETILESDMLFNECIQLSCGDEMAEKITSILDLLKQKDEKIKLISETYEQLHKTRIQNKKSLKGIIKYQNKEIAKLNVLLKENNLYRTNLFNNYERLEKENERLEKENEKLNSEVISRNELIIKLTNELFKDVDEDDTTLLQDSNRGE